MDVAYSPEDLIPERTHGDALALPAAPGAAAGSAASPTPAAPPGLLRQALALGAVDLALLLLRAAAVLVLLSPLLVGALLIFG
ncbi:hypothetical protein JYK14_09325 [Siccirubricoccus sp. KC 17139]|uniref:Uncharacterized protein n=1 Tax=Siccirubricoccus soli TaxID=2899147 RepID=A0ABT1D386_9PROT|nr:hypothetical protein [Siccirubricoccus soli]MCO6416367.1 hypothetical protein [Siccirubricoccus soli]MCP2682501.1 hypothetical protein [Siccirubricoccus soli]